MSGPPRVRSMNVAEPESRPVLVPAGNKARTVENRKSALKPLKKPAQDKETEAAKEKKPVSAPPRRDAASILKRQDVSGIQRLSSMSASCSSDASSTDSSHSRASSSGRVAAGRRRSVGPGRRKQCGLKTEEVGNGGVVEKSEKDVSDIGVVDAVEISLEAKKRCAWVTHNTEPCYAAFHDEEWGVPVHDDKKLFELLSLSGALAELTWPAILSKRHMFREAFLDFDPIAVSKLSEKKITCVGSPANSLLSEAKLRGIIENARQVCKIIDEFGSFNKYIWNFVNQKPIISQYKYPRQVSVKTPKAEVISKDLVRRGFRSVGPTVIYSFMQAAGLTNDHLIGCFRFQECIAMAEPGGKNTEEKKPGGALELGLVSSMGDLSFSS